MSDRQANDAVSLLDLVSNSVILYQLAPYLPLSSRVAVAATSQAYRDVLLNSLETFRHFDVSGFRRFVLAEAAPDRGGKSWRSQRMDEALTPDEFYSGPLRGLFNLLARRKILHNIKTLILDGLSVTAELVSDMLRDDRFNVRILSIRQVRHMNEKHLQQALAYACRPSRPEGTPRIKAIYFFGSKPSTSEKQSTPAPGSSGLSVADQGVLSYEGAQIGAAWNERSQTALNTSLGHCPDRWYQSSGRILGNPPSRGWASTLQACEGIISFDAVLCRGPRHDATMIESPEVQLLPPAIADIALGPAGCGTCGTMPEGPAIFDQSPSHYFPLLEPPPLHSSTVRAAQMPSQSGSNSGKFPPFLARCSGCLREHRHERWCERCGVWWDEFCYPAVAAGTQLQDVSEDASASKITVASQSHGDKKVYMNLCSSCLVSEMMSGAGSQGMWG